jgi:hypothetical protein
MLRIALAVLPSIALIMSAVGSAVAQSIKDIAGTYVLVSETREQNGVKVALPTKGSLSLDISGRYMLTTFQPNLPTIASNNRTTATPEENKAIVSGTLAHFGTFSIRDKTLFFKVELSSFPNWNGIEQRRPFTVNGDELQYVLASASAGGTVTLTWRRVR